MAVRLIFKIQHRCDSSPSLRRSRTSLAARLGAALRPSFFEPKLDWGGDAKMGGECQISSDGLAPICLTWDAAAPLIAHVLAQVHGSACNFVVDRFSISVSVKNFLKYA